MNERDFGYFMAALMMAPLYAYIGWCLWIGWSGVFRALFS